MSKGRTWSDGGVVRAALRVLSAGVLAVSLAAQGEQGDAQLAADVAAVEELVGESEAAAGSGDLGAARQACARARELARLEGATPARLAAMEKVALRLGRHAERLGDQQTALTSLRAVLRHREATLAADDLKVQAARMDVANAMHAAGDLRGARDLKQAVLDAFRETMADDAVNLQMARGSLASTLSDLGDLDGALALQQKVLDVFSASRKGDDPYLQKARMSVSQTLSAMGRFEQALELQRSVLEVRSRTLPDDHPDLQRTRMGLAATLAELGDVQAASELQRKVVDVFSRMLPKAHPYLLMARSNLAVYMRRMGDLHGAYAMQEEILRLETGLLPPDHPQLQRSRGSLASTMSMLGDPYGAFELERQVLDALTANLPEGHPELQMARGNLASTMHVIGDWQGALALQQRVLDEFTGRFADDHPLVRRARGNLALTLRGMERFEEALVIEEAVLAACERSLPDGHAETNGARSNLASTLKALGRTREASELEELVLRGRTDALPADHPELLTARMNHADTLRRLGELDASRELLEQVLRVRQQVLPPEHPDLQLTHLNLALTQQARGSGEEAARHLHAAATGALQLVGDHVLSARVVPSLRMQSARLLGAIVGLLRSDVELSEPRAGELRAVGLRLVVASRSAELHAGELRRSVALRDPEACVRLEGEFVAATQRLEAAVALPRDGRIVVDGKSLPRDDAIRAATLAKDEVERQWLRLAAPELRAAPQLPALAGRLAPGEVAVALCNYPSYGEQVGALVKGVQWRYGAFLLSAGGEVDWLDLAAESDVAELVARLRRSVDDPATGEDVGERALAEIDDLVFAPLRAAMPEGTTRVAISLSRDLRLVPLDVLPAADGLRVEVVWSLRSLLHGRVARADSPSMLAIGDVDYDEAPAAAAPVVAGMSTPVTGAVDVFRGGGGGEGDDVPPKRFTALANAEVPALVEVFEASFPSAEVEVLRGRAASEAAFVAKAPGTSWLHVATHGYFAPEQVWSSVAASNALSARFSAGDGDRAAQLTPYSLTGLALAGANLEPDALGRREGLLTAQEAAALDLSSCYLVTLSACESSLGVRQAGDGLASLRNAFHAAGARFVLASLWKVSDRATEQLMRDFYTRLWQHGDSPHDALRAAQQAARERRAPLREWAGWVLTGR